MPRSATGRGAVEVAAVPGAEAEVRAAIGGALRASVARRRHRRPRQRPEPVLDPVRPPTVRALTSPAAAAPVTIRRMRRTPLPLAPK